jgi:diguanylate cyclase (GGDEF)-like protein
LKNVREHVSRIAQRLLAAALVACAWLLPAAVAGQPLPDNPRYVFQSIGEGTQLATRGVTTMLQDQLGFVWIGTQDGLFRCDGAEVARFGADHGLAHTRITQIVEGPDGTLWVSAGGQLARFDGLRFEPLELRGVTAESAWDQDIRQHIAITSSNTMFAATVSGLATFDLANRRVGRTWTAADGLPEARIMAVHVDARDRIWFAAGCQVGTLEPSSGKVSLVQLPELTREENVVAVLTDAAGRVWLRTRGHLLTREPGSADFEVVDLDLADTLSIGAPTLDRSGNPLVPSVNGLYFKEGDRWKKVSAANGLRASAVTHAIEDREGALWVGLFGPGVQRWAGRRSWAAWTTEEGLPNDGVWESHRDARGRLWVGTNDGLGIWIPGEGSWRVLTPDDGLAGSFVWKFEPGPDGELWSISRRIGLNRFDLESLETEIVSIPGEPQAAPMELARSPDGLLWVGTKEHVWIVDHRDGELTFEELELPPELAGCTESISIASEGAVWIGGNNGLGRFDRKGWTRFGVEDGLRADRVMLVEAISDWEVWIAYEESKGVSRLLLTEEGVRLTHVTAEDGLASDCVWLLESGPEGRVWIGGADGLSVISPGGELRTFDQGDGLIWNDISRDGFWVEPDGSMLIGTSRGLAHYLPAGDVEPMRAPTAAITSAVLGGQQVLGADHPTVSYSGNSLTVKFSGLTFRNPSRVMFKYQLAGLDMEPTLTRMREVRYAALPAGQYRFEVWCRSASGMWSVEPASFVFTIDPPWWERWWVRLAAAVALVLLVLLILQIRTSRLAADRRRLEAAVQERSAQLAAANEELREMSYTDALTMTHNRRFFMTVIDSDVSAALRRHHGSATAEDASDRDLLFFLIDLDHFKRVNDHFGHRVGDEVLVEASARLKATLRRSDLLLRWGGEEFLIVCRDTNREQGQAVAQRILDLVGGEPFVIEGRDPFHRTCSVGWAALPAYPDHPGALTYENVLELADKALYVAKKTGRNRAVGVELVEERYEEARDMRWLDEPLDRSEGGLLRLVRIAGPNVPVELKPSRPPPAAEQSA